MISELPTVCWIVLSTSRPWITFPVWFQVRVDQRWCYTRFKRRKWNNSFYVLKIIFECGARGNSKFFPTPSFHTPYPSVLPNYQPLHLVSLPGPPPGTLLWAHREGSLEESMTSFSAPVQAQEQDVLCFKFSCKLWLTSTRLCATSSISLSRPCFPIFAHNRVRSNLYIKFFIHNSDHGLDSLSPDCSTSELWLLCSSVQILMFPGGVS